MIHKLNFARYCFAVIAPIILVLCLSVDNAILSIVFLLFVNNVIDDLVFYYGGAFIEEPKEEGKILSPIEGLVTKVEKFVPLKRHINKKDVVCGNTYITRTIEDVDNGRLYHHIAVFLNKFNKHIVCNIGSKIKSVAVYNDSGKLVEMVSAKELIAKYDGVHCYNTFFEIEYDNGCVAVITMDKYVSRFNLVIDKESIVDGIIYRGSQCDLYVPIQYEINLKENDTIKCLEPIVEGENDFDIDTEYAEEVVLNEIKKNVGNLDDIIISNARKTLSTNVIDMSYKFFFLIVSFIISPTLCGYVLVFFLLSFYYKRSIKNLLYCVCNLYGYEEWMTKINITINNILV